MGNTGISGGMSVLAGLYKRVLSLSGSGSVLTAIVRDHQRVFVPPYTGSLQKVPQQIPWIRGASVQGPGSPPGYVARPTQTFATTAQRGQDFEVILPKSSCLPFLVLGI